MNNGDSFHNGSENLELQRRIRESAGLEALPSEPETTADEPSADATPATTDPSSMADPTSPAPHVPKNIYADGAPSRPKNIYAVDAPSRPKATGTPVDNPYADPRIEDHTPPHQRPYVNIYATNGGVTYTAGAEKPVPRAEGTVQIPVQERSYTNIYARRVAARTTPTEPGFFGNTPDISQGLPYYGDTEGGDGYGTEIAYGTITAAYGSEEDANETVERERKNKFNLASLILGIASFAGNMVCLTILTPITAILAIIFGCMGRVGGKFQQKGLVGMVLGIVYCGLMLLLLVFIILVAVIYYIEEDPSALG